MSVLLGSSGASVILGSSGGGVVRRDAAAPGAFPDATIATSGAGWVTMGFTAPSGAIPSGDSIQIGALTTQSDIKRTWPDGSAKFLIATANATGAGSHTITKITNPGGTAYTPTWPSASVAFDVGGTVYTATLPSYSGTDSWLSGPVVRESRVLVTPLTGGSTPHASLRVRFDVRSFAAGGHRVDIALENGLNVAGTDIVDYDISVSVAGSTVYTESSVRHYPYKRARLTYWTSTSEATWTPDAQPFIDAKALPLFESGISSSTWTNSGAGYGIFGASGMTVPMSNTGGRAELGFRPDWVAQAIVHGTANQWETVRHRGDNPCGYWQIHITESDGALLTLADKPNFWFDPDKRYSAADGISGPANDMAGVTGYDPDAPGHAGDSAHYPSLAFVPYLVWGDRWCADEVKFQANWHLIATGYGRSAGSGLMTRLGLQERGIAWGVRDLLDACAWLPIDDDVTGLTTILGNNLTDLDTLVAENNDPLGGISLLLEASGHADGLSPWMQYYLIWTLDYAQRLGYTDGSNALTQLVTYYVNLYNEPTFGEYVASYAVFARQIGGTYHASRAAFATYTLANAPSDALTFSTTTYFAETFAAAKIAHARSVGSAWYTDMNTHASKASAISGYPRFAVALTGVGA